MLEDVPHETLIKLKYYVRLLDKWKSRINLISTLDFDNIWQRHIADSLQLLRFIQNSDIHLIDIGTGAGLPGIVLSIAGIKKVTLVESNAKKCAFLLEASRISDGIVTILNDRVEDLQLECDILTARGFAKLKDIFNLTTNIKVKNKYLLLKGINFQEEIDDAQKNKQFSIKLHESLTAKDAKILEIM